MTCSPDIFGFADEPAGTVFRTPAKINLFLRVVRKRTDGYHDLESLMCGIGLFDRIRVRFDTVSRTVRTDHPAVPDDAGNLAHIAACAFLTAAGIDAGFSITIDKRIPVGGGLGGGSGNAAGVLVAFNRRYGLPLSHAALSDIALSIGADVPFFLSCTPSLARGVGERLTPVAGLSPRPVVIVNPGFTVSTAWVFRNLNLGLTKCWKNHTDSNFKESSFRYDRELYNDLETVTEKHYPVIRLIKETLSELGAEGVLMSGSGPSVFAVFPTSEASEHAMAASRDYPAWHWVSAELLV